jgi:sterol desaturase/sphingolipid hydroxylase (fatty acid hydroxylase superfamily)
MTALFIGCAVVFSTVERVWPERARVPYFKRNRWIDWLYWPFTAFFTGNLTRVVTFGVVALIALAIGQRGNAGELEAWLADRSGSFGIGRLPIAAQALIAIAIGDLVDYWNHRLRHTHWLWPFHAIHHAPKTLDWLSSVRMHPVDDLIDNVGVGLVVLAIGTSPAVWLATGPFLFFFNSWLHANVPWRCGWLRYVVATPAFHRWHHAEEFAQRGCNFAGVLPLWDLLFGTYWLPNTQPAHFGPGATVVPKGLVAQLVFPVRETIRRATDESTAPPRS